MENKKIKNATSVTINDIKFRSKLESRVYEEISKSNLPFSYETEKIVLLDGFYPSVPYYLKGKSGHLEVINKKQLSWQYTPDFIITTSGWKFYIEVKGGGFSNDLWPYKRKMFLKTLQDKSNVAFFEVHSIREIKECINIIKHEYEDKIIEHYEEKSL